MNDEQSKIDPDAALKLAQMGAAAEQFKQVMLAINEVLRKHNLLVAEGRTWAVYGLRGVKLPDGEKYHEFVTASEAVTDALTIAFERTDLIAKEAAELTVEIIKTFDETPSAE